MMWRECCNIDVIAARLRIAKIAEASRYYE